MPAMRNLLRLLRRKRRRARVVPRYPPLGAGPKTLGIYPLQKPNTDFVTDARSKAPVHCDE